MKRKHLKQLIKLVELLIAELEIPKSSRKRDNLIVKGLVHDCETDAQARYIVLSHKLHFQQKR